MRLNGHLFRDDIARTADLGVHLGLAVIGDVAGTGNPHVEVVPGVGAAIAGTGNGHSSGLYVQPAGLDVARAGYRNLEPTGSTFYRYIPGATDRSIYFGTVQLDLYIARAAYGQLNGPFPVKRRLSMDIPRSADGYPLQGGHGDIDIHLLVTADAFGKMDLPKVVLNACMQKFDDVLMALYRYGLPIPFPKIYIAANGQLNAIKFVNFKLFAHNRPFSLNPQSPTFPFLCKNGRGKKQYTCD